MDETQNAFIRRMIWINTLILYLINIFNIYSEFPIDDKMLTKYAQAMVSG